MISFWFFMFFITFIIPLVMILFGIRFVKFAPREINNTYGYRTGMSMKNKDTWSFAHMYIGRLWFKLGIILLILSIISMLFTLMMPLDSVGIFGGVVVGIQLIVMITPIFFTEKALKQNFDKNGNSRN